MRNRTFDHVFDLVLFKEHINFTAIRRIHCTCFHGESELRSISNCFRNSTFIENSCHQKVLMHREGNTNNRVERTKRSSFRDTLNIIFEQRAEHKIMITNCCCILEIRVFSIESIFQEELFHGITERSFINKFLRFGIDIITFIQTSISYLKKVFCKTIHLIFFITAKNRILVYGITTADYWHNFSSFKSNCTLLVLYNIKSTLSYIIF